MGGIPRILCIADSEIQSFRNATEPGAHTKGHPCQWIRFPYCNCRNLHERDTHITRTTIPEILRPCLSSYSETISRSRKVRNFVFHATSMLKGLSGGWSD